MPSFENAVAAFSPALPLAVGYSGGADSTALLLASAARWPGQVAAVHVHHGLQPAADDFARHCETVCATLGVPLALQRVDARHARGASPEDTARRARFSCFSAVARTGIAQLAIKTIALAQHADDQAETLLLALSRGAGVAGLAGMAAAWQQGGTAYARPLLGVHGADIRRWLASCGAAWIDDPSNGDIRLTRNRIRHTLLPALDAALPQFRATFARSARHAAEAAQLLRELAGADLAQIGDPPAIAALQTLSSARQANALRHWLRTVHATTPSTAQLDEVLAQLADCTTRGHRIELVAGRGQVVRDGGVLRFRATSTGHL